MSPDETKLDQEQVRNEHLSKMSIAAHWLYLFGVFGGGFMLMVALMALLGGGGS